MNNSRRSADSIEARVLPQDPFGGISGCPLSQAGHVRHDEILADILARSPAIRRDRVARRCARAAAPVVLVVLLALGLRSLLPGAHRSLPGPADPRPIALGTSAPDATARESLEVASEGVAPAHYSSSVNAGLVRIVSTAGTSFADRIVSSRDGDVVRRSTVVQTIDDQMLMLLLAQEGRSDGIVRIGDRTMLASDLARENPAMPSPAGPPGLPIPATPLMPGL